MDVDNLNKSADGTEQGAEGQQGAGSINFEALYKEASKSVLELTAERDSLKTENEELRAAKDAAIAEGAKAREMNYTLSRQLNIQGAAKKEPEAILAEMFLKKGE